MVSQAALVGREWPPGGSGGALEGHGLSSFPDRSGCAVVRCIGGVWPLTPSDVVYHTTFPVITSSSHHDEIQCHLHPMGRRERERERSQQTETDT